MIPQVEFFCSFSGRIEDTINYFWDLLTFKARHHPLFQNSAKCLMLHIFFFFILVFMHWCPVPRIWSIQWIQYWNICTRIGYGRPWPFTPSWSSSQRSSSWIFSRILRLRIHEFCCKGKAFRFMESSLHNTAKVWIL